VPTLIFWGALQNYRAGIASQLANEASDAFQQARYSVGEEESLERQYRLEPTQEIRARHTQAAAEMVSWLEKARARERGVDVAAIEAIVAKHATYLVAVSRMFTAIDLHDAVLANDIDRLEADPAFDAIEQAVSSAAERHRLVGTQQLARLVETQQTVLLATPVIFVIGLVFAAFFANVLRRLQAQAVASGLTATLRSERRFKELVRHAADVILICDMSGTVTYRAPTSETASAFASEDVTGNMLACWIHPEDQAAFRDVWQQVEAARGLSNCLELRSCDSENDWRYVELTLTNLSHERDVGGVVVNVHDITERKLFEQQLTTQAFYDSLTSLPNRALLLDRIEQSLSRASQRSGTIGLMFFDIDNFKLVNDGLGHEMGDALLVTVAKRLEGCVRPSDTVARLGGDEFVILLDQLGSDPTREAIFLAERITKKFREPVFLGSKEHVVSGSLGISLADTASGFMDSTALLRNADVAMYRAKSSGKGHFAVFDAEMHIDIISRFELEADLRKALEKHELRVHYQPIVQLQSEKCIEVEALVRWQHPTRGLINPGEFISIAEDTGLIIPMGLWVLEEACRHAASWQQSYPSEPPLQVSVNLSPRQFEHADLLADVRQALEQAKLPPASLRLEVTEGVIMRDTESSIRTLRELKELGIRIAIDDFGTGYSSLSYLKMLPLDVLKIDRSFVRGIGQNTEDDAIVQAIISLARSLGLGVTAEGIETAGQAELLRQWSCEKGQGFLFAHPLEAGKVGALLGAVRVRSSGTHTLVDSLHNPSHLGLD
jgi:diguanylate cyclase (GGDEF)-like protein/PAS domain S-box-containing protein